MLFSSLVGNLPRIQNRCVKGIRKHQLSFINQSSAAGREVPTPALISYLLDQCPIFSVNSHILLVEICVREVERWIDLDKSNAIFSDRYNCYLSD